MKHNHQLNTLIDNIITINISDFELVSEKIVNDYQELNEKCNKILSKIKERKQNKPFNK